MWLQPRGVIRSGVDLLDMGVDHLDVHVTAQGVFLIAHNGKNGGFVSYRLHPSGSVTVQQTQYYGANVLFASGVGQQILRWNNEDVLFFGANGAELVGYRLHADGTFGAVRRADWSALDAAIAGGQTQALTAWAMLTDLPPPVLSGHAAATGTVALTVAQAGGQTYWLAVGGGAAQVDVLRMVGAGSVTVSSMGMAQGLGIQAPTALEVVTIQGQTYAILAAAGSGSLSVLHLRPDGALIPTDHVLDTLHTRFQSVQALTSVQVGDHVFVIAGGGDHGLTLFQLLPDGRLLWRETIANGPGLTLHNVTALESALIGTEIHIFAGSQRDAGLTHFVLPVADLGQVIRATAPLTTGGAGRDVLVATADGDTLRGGAGDDVLVAGPGRTWLLGQGGADTFVMRAGSGTTYVQDFQRGVDRLDLSDWMMLRNLDQLTLTQTAQGARLAYQGHLVDITAADGRPLTLADLFPSGLQGPDRILVLSPDALPVTLPVLSITPLSATVTEGDSGTTQATFRVSLSAASGGPVTVSWAVTGAFSGQALPSGTLTFAPGQTEAVLALPVHGDLIPEPVSDFTVTLTNPQGATLGTAAAAGRILDDDPVLLARSDSAAATAAGPVITGNVLVNDQGKGLIITNPVSGLTGALGTLTLAANGQFSYSANRAQPLPQGVTGTDTFSYTVRDASGAVASTTLTITVTGVNDPATITGPRVGVVWVADPGSWEATGRLIVTDPDIGQDRFALPPGTAGSYGTFSFNALTGVWSYALNPNAAAVRAMAPGRSAADVLTVHSLDGTASAQIAITVNGPPLAEPPVQVAGVVALRQAVIGAVPPGGTQVSVTPADGSRQTTLTDAQGQFALTLPPGTQGTLELVRNYTAGQDKTLSVFDAIALFNLVAGRAPAAARADPLNLIAADFNGNGTADINDVIDLFRFVAGAPGAVQPRYVFVADADLPLVTPSQVPVPSALSVFDDLSLNAYTGILRGDIAGYF